MLEVKFKIVLVMYYVAGVPDKWVLSKLDRSKETAVAADGLKCQSRDQYWNGVRSVKGVANKGKYYYEATVSDEGLCRVGWSTIEVIIQKITPICNIRVKYFLSNLQALLDLGTDPYGFGFGGTGKKSNNRQFDDYGFPFGLNDVIGCALDIDNKFISFYKNGESLGTAFQFPNDMKNKGFFPAVVLKVNF